MFKAGGMGKREAISKLMQTVTQGLETVTTAAPDYETLMVAQAARRLYETPGQQPTLGQVVELNRRFLEGYLHFKDEPRVQKLRDDVLRYNRSVRDLGLRDHQVRSVYSYFPILYILHVTGSSSGKRNLENAIAAALSDASANYLGVFCTSRLHSEFAHLFVGFRDIQEKGER
jgi:hypothetical protein